MKPILLTAALAATAVSASAASAEEWNAFSSNAKLVYLADVSAIYTVGDTTEVRVARVSLETPTSDYSHKIDDYQFRCAAKQARIVAEAEYGPDGAEVERYPEADAAWDDIRPNTLGAFLQTIACDGARANGDTSASIKAFIDGGRGH